MNILKVKREERGVFLFAIVLTMVLNALTISHYFGDFTTLHNNYFNLFASTKCCANCWNNLDFVLTS